jgi:hypothetical protein
MQEAVRTIDGWLKDKNLPIPAKNGNVTKSGKKVSHFESQTDAWASSRWQVDEEWDYPNWYDGEKEPNRHGLTSITLIRDSIKLWVWVEVDSPILAYNVAYKDEPVVEPQFAATPKVLRDLISTLELSDGSVPVFGADAIHITSQSHLQSLFSAISDSTRISTLMVTAPAFGESIIEWETKLKPLVATTAGISNLVVVHSDLIGNFNNVVGRDLLTPRGSIRSFLPGAIFGDKADSFRHKLLSAKSLEAKPIDKTARLLNRISRARINNLKLPRTFLEVDAALIKLSRFSLVISNVELEKKIVGLSEDSTPELTNMVQELITEKRELEELAELYARENSELKSEVNDLRELEGLLLASDAITFDNEQQISSLLDEVARLRQLLASQGRVEEAYAPSAQSEISIFPETFEELISRMNEFEFLEFRGDRESAFQLDEHPGIQSAIPKAWNTLRTLESYSRFKSEGKFSGSLMNWVENSSHGGFVQGPSIKPNESETVLSNRRLRELREIRVPIDVDPTGVVVTKMHVALQTAQSNYPRMYFYDASGKNGMVYIGYLGEHLENTRTN